MSTKFINDVVTGSILAEPVTIGQVMLVRAGVPISEQLKQALPKFGVTEVTIESVFTDEIDKSALNFTKLTNVTYLAMKRLDIANVIMCAKNLVSNSLQNDDCALLGILFDYDEGTYWHSINVATFAVTVGINIGLTIDELHTLAIGALLHDIGKAEIPREIINKPEKLTDEEFEVVKEHPHIGYLMSKDSDSLNSSIRQIIYQHHENYDGTGYPRKLYGKNSFKLARLIHICDVYEALCAKRPYKEQLPRRVVREIMLDGSGTQFDPALLKRFFDTIPLYLVGETVESDGRVGIVCDIADGNHPLVYCDGVVSRLEDFEKLGTYSNMLVSEVS